jgi:hypothetical protein
MLRRSRSRLASNATVEPVGKGLTRIGTDFVNQVRQIDVTPHVAQNDTRRGDSAMIY